MDGSGETLPEMTIVERIDCILSSWELNEPINAHKLDSLITEVEKRLATCADIAEREKLQGAVELLWFIAGQHENIELGQE